MAPFAWPLGIAIIAIAAFLIFRPAFLRLLDRVSKAGKEGISFERSQEGKKSESALSFDELMKSPITVSVLEREKTLQANLQSFNLKDDKEKTSVLIRALAQTLITLEFNNFSAVIFGSQLSLLLRLSGPDKDIALPQAESIFTQAQSNFTTLHANRTFKQWLDYLLANNLIIQTGESLAITQYGSDFLKHLVDAHLVYERQG